MSIWHIFISENLSVYGRYVVGLFSVWVRDCRSAVGYNSSSVLMIGFQSVWCRLCIGLKSGDSIPNLTRNDPDMNPTGFTVSSATLSVADSWQIHWKFCGFCRFRVGLAGVTGVLHWCLFPRCFVTRVSNIKIIPSWAHRLFATPVHTLLYTSHHYAGQGVVMSIFSKKYFNREYWEFGLVKSFLFTVCGKKYCKSHDLGNAVRGAKRPSYLLSQPSAWRRDWEYLPHDDAAPADWRLWWGLQICRV